MAEWSSYGASDRGRFIRYYFSRVNELPPSVATKSFIGKGMTLGEKEFPTAANMKAFRTSLMGDKDARKKFIDSFGVSFNTYITDEEIGLIFGTHADLKKVDPNTELTNYDTRISMDTAARESGIALKSIKRNAETTAIIDPKMFLQERDMKLAEIDKKALDVYKKSLDIYTYEYQFSSEDAKNKAKEDMKRYKKSLVDKLDILYGKDAVGKAEKHIIKV